MAYDKFQIDDSGVQTLEEAAANTTKEQYIYRLLFACAAVVCALTIAWATFSL